MTFCDLVADFLKMSPGFEGKQTSDHTSPPPAKKKRSDLDSIIDADEDDQLAAAIRASLAESTTAAAAGEGEGNGKEAKDSDNGSDYDLDFTDDDTNMSTPSKAPPPPSSSEDKKPVPLQPLADDKWEDYLGNPDDAKSSIMIRFPDGKRETKNIPCSSTFMVSIQYYIFF